MALGLMPHSLSWKTGHVTNVFVACAALYLALHSCMVVALADVPNKHNAMTIARLRIMVIWKVS